MLKSTQLWRGLSSFKIDPHLFTVLVVITSSILIQCASGESAIISGKCDTKYSGEIRKVNCSNYTEIPTNIATPETVNHLQMNEGNHFETIKNGSLKRSKLINLQYLKLLSCQIRFIEPGAFTGESDLRHIDLTGNMITTLNPLVFADAMNLTEIILQKNPLKRIAMGQVFPNLPELKTLDLSDCQLDSLQTNVFDNLKDLINLYLDGNHLKHLNWKIFRKTRYLHLLTLQNNPWHCDCSLKFLLKTLKNRSLDMTFHLAICASADDQVLADWFGKPLNYIPENEITCWPRIDKFMLTSYLSHAQRNESSENMTVTIGENVYFDCEYSGYPKPTILWFKDKHTIKQSVSESIMPDTNTTQFSPKVEVQDVTSTILENMEDDEQRNNFNWKGRLIVRRVQSQDAGTYECFVQFDNVKVRKTLYLNNLNIAQMPVANNIISSRESETNTTSVWMWTLVVVAIFCGFILLIVVVTKTSWKRRWFREKKGITKEESSNDFGVFWHRNNEDDV